jgi:hypothetical protein
MLPGSGGFLCSRAYIDDNPSYHRLVPELAGIVQEFAKWSSNTDSSDQPRRIFKRVSGVGNET